MPRQTRHRWPDLGEERGGREVRTRPRRRSGLGHGKSRILEYSDILPRWSCAMAESLQRFKAELFKALAHPARIRILECLREGEKSVGEIQLRLGQESSTVSQQLAILRMRNLVGTRRAGNQIYYHLRDPQVNELLDVARNLFDTHLVELQAISGEEPERAAR